MVTVEIRVAIKRPPEEVFAFLANTENETQWQPGLIESKFTSPAPMGVGTTGRDVRKFMGMKTVTTWQVTAFEPNQRIAFRVITGPMPFEAFLVFEPAPHGVTVTYNVQAQTRGFSKLFDPLSSRLIRRQGETQMASLKALLEARA